MKNRLLSIIISFLVVLATGFILLSSANNKKQQKKMVSELLSRNEILSRATEWEAVKTSAVALEQKIKRNPADIKSLLALCSLYLGEARATGNLSYYNHAAMKCAKAVLEKEPGNFE